MAVATHVPDGHGHTATSPPWPTAQTPVLLPAWTQQKTGGCSRLLHANTNPSARRAEHSRSAGLACAVWRGEARVMDRRAVLSRC